MIDRQRVFDDAVKGLKSQGFERSMGVKLSRGTTYESCAYRGTNGLRCALGWLIHDDVYDDSIEGKSSFTLLFRSGEAAERYARVRQALVEHYGQLDDASDYEFMSSLQSAHDDSYDAENMKARLRGLGERFDLDVSALDG